MSDLYQIANAYQTVDEISMLDRVPNWILLLLIFGVFAIVVLLGVLFTDK